MDAKLRSTKTEVQTLQAPPVLGLRSRLKPEKSAIGGLDLPKKDTNKKWGLNY
jgi:hypothetical protein